jgi:hypothetical protein
MTRRFQVGDLVISRAKAKIGRPVLVNPNVFVRPALVIGIGKPSPFGLPTAGRFLRLKAGEAEWWASARFCEKVSE